MIYQLLIVAFANVALSQTPADIQYYNGVGELSLELLKKTLSSGQNDVLSAYSIGSALGMCLLGAEGITKNEMSSVLGLSGLSAYDRDEAFKSTSTSMLLNVGTGNTFTISVANRIYVNVSYALGKSYVNNVKQVFSAEAVNVDFKADAPGVEDQINTFVKNNTRGLIPKILSGPLDKETVMALVNAIYFKGQWKTKLDIDTSNQKKFNSIQCADPSVETEQDVTWMRATKEFDYSVSSVLEAKTVELPYNSGANGAASLLILLPDEKHQCNLSNWMNLLSWQKIQSEISKASMVKLQLKLPKFIIQSSFELSKALLGLGMPTAFSNEADFNGMVDDQGDARIKIDQVIHQAKINVNENGTEAAAATVVTIVRTQAIGVDPSPPIPLDVNRSFLCFIVYRNGNAILPLFSAVVNSIKG